MAEYKILLGTKLDTSDLQSQIDKAGKNKKIKLDVKLNSKGISDQIKAINSKTPVKVSVKLDTKSAQSQISNLRKQIQQLGNIKINLGAGNVGGNGKRQANEVAQSYRELMRVLNELNSKRLKLNGLNASSPQSSQQIQRLRLQIEQLKNEYNNLINTFSRQGIQFSAQQWDNIENAIARTGRQIDVVQAKMSDNSAVKQQTQAYKELLSISKQISSIELNIGKLKGQGGNANQIAELENQLRILQSTYQRLVSTMNTPLTASQWSSLYTEIASTQDKLAQLNAKIADTKAKLASGIKLKLSDGTFTNDISRIESGFNSLANKSTYLSAGIEQVKKALSSMRAAAAANDTQALIDANERYRVALKSVENQLKINARAEKEANNTAGLDHAKQRLALEMSNWLKNNSAAATQFGGRIQELQAKINSCNRASLANLRAEFQNITKQATLAGKATQSFRDKLKTQFSRYSSYLSVASAFMYTTMALRDMFRQVVSIDTAMTELKKVTDETSSTYNNFLKDAATRSKELGTTVDGLVNSTADFARLGYEFSEAQGLAEVANIYAVVSDEINGVEGATESLISTLAAFKDEMNGLSDTDFAMSIIDKFNEVSNNFAISSGGIGEALKRSASSLASANNTLDESIALITAANTVVQDPDRVGNAFKTVSMRIRGAKTELEEAGLETEGMVESTAKLRQEIMALSGVDIMLNENTFKSTYDIMDELSQKWEDLSDIAQATIIELIAGKHQGNVISSLMSNFDVARDALETSLNSSGSAMKEHEKWQQSLEARINKLKATWQSLALSFMSSNFLKGLLDGITSLIDCLDKIINMFGTLPTLFGAFAAGKYLYSGKGLFQVVKDEATGAAKGITTVFGQAAKESENVLKNIGLRNSSVFKDGLKSDIAALNNYRMSVKGGMSETVAMSMHMNDASAAAKEYAKSGKLASEGVNGFVKQQKAVKVSMLASNKSLSNASAIIKEYSSGCKATGMSQKDFRAAVAQTNPALASQLSATKSTKTAMVGYVTSLVGAKVATIGLQVATMALNMALTMGIAALVSWGISKLGEYIETSKELSERIDEVTSKYKEQRQELNKIKSDYDTSNEDSMISKYGELSKGVNALGENVALTADEYAEYRDIVNTVAEQIPGLVTGYNSQGDAILSCAGDVNVLAEAYKNLVLEQNKVVLDTGADIFKDFKNNANLTSQMEGVSATRHLDELNNILESYKEDEKYGSLVMWAEELSPSDIGKITSLLKENGFEQNTLFGGGEGFETKKEFIVRAIKEDAKAVKDALKDAYDDIDAYADDLNTFTDAYLSTEFLTDYSHMSDRMQGAINQIASSFDTNFYEQFGSIDELEGYLDSMLSAFDNLGAGEKSQFEAAFDLKTQFNGGKISLGEYVNGLQDAARLIDEMDLAPEIKSQIKLSLGLSESSIKDNEWVVEEYENTLNRLTSKKYDIQLDTETAKSFLDDLSAEELNVVVKFINEDNDEFKETIQGYGDALEYYKSVLSEAEQAGVDFSKTVYGNIDTNARQVLEWTSENLEKYKDALMSWEPSTTSWDDLKSSFEGSISTIMGAWNEFEIDGKEVDIAFSPMLQTDSGAEILSSGTVSSYINGLIDKATADGKWDNAELFALDAEGLEIDGKKIKGLLADIGETAEATAEQMHFVGKDGALALAEAELSSVFAMVEKQAKINEAMNFSPNIEVDTASLEAFNTALAESVSAIGLSNTAIDSLKSKYSDLEGYDPSTLFESTANGVKINREEVSKLEKEYQNLKKAEVQEHIDSLTNAYNENVAAIDKCANASERLDLIRENETYKSQIEELATYQAQLEGVTGAYQRWIDAQATPESYEGYEAVAQGREAIEDELKRGFLGNATKEYIDLLSGKDLIGGTIDDYYAAWKDLNNKIGSTSYSIHDLFTVDTDGNVTATGVHRFFEGVQKDFKDSVAKFNEETGKWTYDFSQENLQKIQDEWGLGIEAIGLMLEAAASAGYEVDFGGILDNIDLDTSSFETLIEVAEEAQKAFNELEGVDDVHFNFSATGIEEATSEIEKAREAYIDLITDEDGNVDLSVTGAEEMRFMLSTLIVQKQQLEDSNIVLSIDTSQLDESQAEIGAAIDAVIQFRESYKNLEIAVETGEGIEEAKTELSAAMTELQGLGDEGVDIAAQLILGEGADASTLQSEIDAAVVEIGKPDITVGCKLDETSIGNLNSQLLTNFTPEATVKITKIDDTLVAGYTSTEKTANGTVVWTNDDKLVKQFINSKHEASGSVKWKNNSKNLTLSGWKATGTVTWTSGNNVQVKVVKLAKGTAYMSGAAHASGSTGLSGRAFAQGNWGIRDNGVALGGEIGREVVVRDGKFFTIGDNGAEFFKYKKNDIVFNATQTEALFKYGGIKGANPRGKMLASGSAFASGNYPSDGSAFAWTSNVTGGSNFANDSKNNTVSTSTSNKTSSNKTDSSSKKTEEAAEKTKEAAEEFKESIDLIEIAIDRLERTISQLDTQANSAYRSWEERNSALIDQISKTGEEIALQKQARDKYLSEANKIELDVAWKEKIKHGEINIEEITDEELADKISQYQELYEKYLDCVDAIIELQEAESELYKQRFDNVLAQYEGMLSIIEHEKNMLDEFVAQSEAQGHLISENYYNALIKNEQKQISKLQEEKTALLAELQTAMQSGKIAKGSEAW